MKYRCSQGDVLDAVALKYYGRADAVMAVLNANPGLAALGPILPEGQVIDLPDLPPPPVAARLRLWD